MRAANGSASSDGDRYLLGTDTNVSNGSWKTLERSAPRR